MKGITVILYEVTPVGKDPFNEPVYGEVPVEVQNVLVSPASSTDILDATNLYGKTAVYTLGIPKGDAHEWEDRKVRFFDKDWHVFGIPTEGIDDLIPLAWNKKVMVERYE
jgi:hypothetical protein